MNSGVRIVTDMSKEELYRASHEFSLERDTITLQIQQLQDRYQRLGTDLGAVRNELNKRSTEDALKDAKSIVKAKNKIPPKKKKVKADKFE